MAQDNKRGAAKAASNAPRGTKAPEPTPPGTEKPEPHDADNRTEDKSDPTASQEAVDAQRAGETEGLIARAEERGTSGDITSAQKAAQTRSAAEAVAKAEADAKARVEADQAAVDAAKDADQGTDHSETTTDPVQRQRDEEVARAAEVAAKGTADLTDEDKRLLAAAPGGQRTALTDGREGSTTVSHTAAQARMPLSGPLSPPVNDVENLAAREGDADNRVYADEAGPRDVFTETEPVKARFVDSDGNALAFEDMFETAEGKTFMFVKTRVYEMFTYPNTTVEGKRLAYSPGKKVAVGEAENVRNLISVHSPIL